MSTKEHVLKTRLTSFKVSSHSRTEHLQGVFVLSLRACKDVSHALLALAPTSILSAGCKRGREHEGASTVRDVHGSY
jgi:hypothetical protein